MIREEFWHLYIFSWNMDMMKCEPVCIVIYNTEMTLFIMILIIVFVSFLVLQKLCSSVIVLQNLCICRYLHLFWLDKLKSSAHLFEFCMFPCFLEYCSQHNTCICVFLSLNSLSPALFRMHDVQDST